MLKELKARLVFLFSVITYLIAGLSSLICNRLISRWYGLLIGIVFVVIAIVVHFIAKKKAPLLFIVSCCINAIATGFCIGSYYSQEKIFLSVVTVALIFLPYLLLCYLVCFWLSNAKKKKFPGILLGFLFAACFLVLILFWNQSTLFSYGFFTLLIALFYYVLCLLTFHTSRNILTDLSLTSFGLFLIVFTIVSVILSDGDALNLIPDGGYSDKYGKQKQRQK